MSKKTIALYAAILVVFAVAAGFLGYDLGKSKESISAYQVNSNSQSSATARTTGASKDTDDNKTANASKIAVVNLDEGTKVGNKTVYYAEKTIEFPSPDFQYTSLSEAEDGLKKGTLGAYIIIPAEYSNNVVSLNKKPVASKLNYTISKKLNGKQQFKMLYNIVSFGNSVNNNLSYMYLENTLSEFHDAQDSAKTVLKNDNKDVEAINDLSSYDLISLVSMPDMDEVEDNTKPLDLSACSTANADALNKIDEEYQTIVKDTQTKLENVEKGKTTLSQTLQKLSNEMKDDTTSEGQDKDPDSKEKADIPKVDPVQQAKANLSAILQSLADKNAKDKEDLQNKVNDVQVKVDDLEQYLKNNSSGALNAGNIPELEVNLTDLSNQGPYFTQKVEVTFNTDSLNKKVDKNQIPTYVVEIKQDATKKTSVSATQTLIQKLNEYLTPEQMNEFCAKCDGDANFKNTLMSIGIKEGKTQNFVDELRNRGTDMLWANAVTGVPNYSAKLSDLTAFAKDQATVQDKDSESESKNKELNYQLSQKIAGIRTGMDQIKDSSDSYFNFNKEATFEAINSGVILPLISQTSQAKQSFEQAKAAINDFTKVLDDNKINVNTGFSETATSTLSKNGDTLLDLVSESNESYSNYAKNVYNANASNISAITDSISQADDEAKANIEKGLADVKALKNANSQSNQELMGDFIDKLPYTRLGSLENKKAYEFMASPVVLKGNGKTIGNEKVTREAQGQKEGNDEKKLEVKPTHKSNLARILIIAILIGVILLAIAAMIATHKAGKGTESWE
ncbi:hypothetical protein [Lachnobacterium bovis]|uniref:hypothetical protein n=1 Tax=Lachnobacterium bovis TaxID=140626 RepID=UPI00048F86BB|nr:hypothetical protein [Lachnobacterium bovis]